MKKLQLILRYLIYLVKSRNEYLIHSPFVYDFVTNVIYKKTSSDINQNIENLRGKLNKNNNYIKITDFGAGSLINAKKERKIKDIAKNSAKSKKYGNLIYRIVKYFKPKNIFELGTSFGISTLYLSSANPDSNIKTFEGCNESAKIASENNMKVLYFNRSNPKETYGAEKIDTMKELLEKSDVVSIHCPLTPETNNLISKKELSYMKKNSTLINTARGPIVNLDDLYQSLSKNEIAYAALDVTDPEPINMDHPILHLNNLTILPHIASATVETRRKMSKMTVDNIIEGLNSKLPTYCVNSEEISWWVNFSVQS